MHHIVRRVSQTPALVEGSSLALPKPYRAEGLFVQSQRLLGVEPKLYLSWSVVPRYWAKGYAPLVFHNMSGFCPERYPEDLNRHGQLVIEATADGSVEEHPAEGTHFYTFLLHRKGFFHEKMSQLRFSEMIPSAKVAIGRIKDQIELQELLRRHELGGIEHEARLVEARMRHILVNKRYNEMQNPPARRSTADDGMNPLIAKEMSSIDTMVAALQAKRLKIESLKADPEFQKLSPDEQKMILETIEDRLHPGEISARDEQ